MMIMTDPFTTNLVVKGPVVKGATSIISIIIIIVIIIRGCWCASSDPALAAN